MTRWVRTLAIATAVLGCVRISDAQTCTVQSDCDEGFYCVSCCSTGQCMASDGVRPTPCPCAPPRTPTRAPSGCIGDCDGDGAVEIAELILAVNHALGQPEVCLAADGDANGVVSIDELVYAVRAALSGCPAPTVTRPPTATPTLGPALQFDPPGDPPAPAVQQSFNQCRFSFELRVSNAGPVDSRYEIRSLSLWHGYSQGYYSQGFSWDLSDLTDLPIVVEQGEEIRIPLSFDATGLEFHSRLHIAINQQFVGDWGEFHAIFLGRSDETCVND